MNEPLTPEEYQQLLDLGTENSGLEQQMAMAKQLRSPLQTRGSPRGYQVAPHWTELLGNVGSDYVGQQAGQKSNANMGAQNRLLMQGILGRKPAPFSQGSTTTVGTMAGGEDPSTVGMSY